MTVSNLMLSILSMDAYNQGGDVGVKGLGTQIGDATRIRQSGFSVNSSEVAAGTLLGDPQTAMDWLNAHYPLMPALQATHFGLPLHSAAASFNPAWIAETASASLLIRDSASGSVI